MEKDKLTIALNQLEKTQAKMVSLRWSFLRGVMQGLGFFVGGTLLVAIIVYVLAALGVWPIISELVNKVN
jgi:hypothetical protein